MQVDQVASIGGSSSFLTPSQKIEANHFEKLLNEEIKQINEGIKRADNDVRMLAVGETDNIHQVMLSVSKAQTSFELAVQVRNRVVEGVQELLRMSI